MLLNKNQYITLDGMVYLVMLALMTALFGLVLPFSILVIFDRVVPNAAMTTLWFIFAIIMVSIYADSFVKSLEEKFTGKIAKNFEQEITNAIFIAICRANIERFNRYEIGEYLERIRTIPSLRNYFGGDAVKAFVNVVTCVIILSVIALINIKAGYIVIGACVVLFVISHVLSKKKVARLQEKSTLEGTSSSKIVEIVSNPLNLKTAAMEYRMENFMDDIVEQREEQSIVLEKLEAQFPLILELTQQISIACVVVACALSVINQEMSQGGMAAIILLTNRYFSPYRQIMSTLGLWKVNMMQLRRLEEILELEEAAGAEDIELIDPQKLTIEADKNYRFKKGHIYVLSGPSCSGNPHLMKCITGERSDTDIAITLNGQSLQEYDIDVRKNAVITVNADSSFIEGTIIENITCFRPKLYKAAYALCEALAIKDIIDKLPRGFYTELTGTRNYPFSRQVHFSLLIIRALLCKKAILIIDDIDLVHDKPFEQNLLRCVESRVDDMICFFISNKMKQQNHTIVQVPIQKMLLPPAYKDVGQVPQIEKEKQPEKDVA